MGVIYDMMNHEFKVTKNNGEKGNFLKNDTWQSIITPKGYLESIFDVFPSPLLSGLGIERK